VNSRFDILSTPIAGLYVVQRKPFGDSRGYFERMFCDEELQVIVGTRKIVQINQTFTAGRGRVRGMHFQHPPYAETKFVSCVRGEVFDVAVDLRRDSPTFLCWHAETLSAENHKTLVIPEGFAHGFQTLCDDCHMLYFHTAAYRSEAEGGLHPQDPRVAIQWPLQVVGLSTRDAAHRFVTSSFLGLIT
jgi:dTDP-4-dehydrorhamnose 3,5-epimerase